MYRRYEPQATGRSASRLAFLLSWDFSGDVIAELGLFEYELGRYEEQSGEEITDVIKMGVVLRELPDSPLRRHMIMNAEQLRGWPAFRDMIVRVLRAESPATGAGPMDTSAFGKGEREERR